MHYIFVCVCVKEERNDRLDEIAEEIDKTIESASSVDCTFTRAGLPRKGEVVLGLHAADGAVSVYLHFFIFLLLCSCLVLF